MLAICSDLDETPDRAVYALIAKYLNTTATTSMGPGVGLEVGNTIYFHMPPGQYSYWGTDDRGREMARALMHSGHIDCLHSYGDLATTRRHAGESIEELNKYDCKLQVWVDHSQAPTNFGPDIMVGRGDLPGSEVYHADLTLAYGIRYVWRGRTTAQTGQNAARDVRAFTPLCDLRHPIAGGRTVAKEFVKIALGRRGNPQWEMHAANRSHRVTRLRDGQPVWEFLRSNPYWAGTGQGDTAEGIGRVLSQRMLDGLVAREGVCILYTHLGKVRDPRVPFGPAARDAFARLARADDDGRLLVTTTVRLLRYLTMRDCVRYSVKRRGEGAIVTIESIEDAAFGPRIPAADELQGLTFVAPRGGPVEVYDPAGRAIPTQSVDSGEAQHVSIPWRRLEFPDLDEL